MSDKSFLQWPFFNDEHQALAARLDDWASSHLPAITADEHHDLDGTCKAIRRGRLRNLCGPRQRRRTS
jgi:acyl-CoA dehydrogenase